MLYVLNSTYSCCTYRMYSHISRYIYVRTYKSYVNTVRTETYVRTYKHVRFVYVRIYIYMYVCIHIFLRTNKYMYVLYMCTYLQIVRTIRTYEHIRMYVRRRTYNHVRFVYVLNVYQIPIFIMQF
jgi:hypothetical protein